MFVRVCVECRLTYDVSHFVPRRNSQYEDLPSMVEVRRQPRCRGCNEIYSRRRSLFRGRISRMAEQHGVEVRARPRSVFRVVEVAPSAVGREILYDLQEVARDFNASLPEDLCDVERHGVRVVLARPEVFNAPRQTLLSLEGVSF